MYGKGTKDIEIQVTGGFSLAEITVFLSVCLII